MNRSMLLLVLLLLGLAVHVGFASDRFSVSARNAQGILVLRDTVAGIEATVAPSRGAELTSFRVMFKNQWLELLQTTDDSAATPGSVRQGAILWPASTADNVSNSPCSGSSPRSFDSRAYPVAGLGFARDLPWTEVDRSADNQGARATLELRDSAVTWQCYPFGFRFEARFELSGGQLTIDYTVKADPSNSKPMIFSIGNQISFRIPFVPGTDPAAMTFETPASTQLLRDSRGFLNDRVKARSFASPTRLGDFDARVALPLAGYHILQPYALLRDPQGLSLRLTQQTLSNLPEPSLRFNVYGGPQAGFLSPEPWFGMQESRRLAQSAISLSPAGSWVWRVQLKPAVPPPDSPRSPGVVRVAGDLGYVEGPVWSKQGFLIFSDMLAQRILRLSTAGHVGDYRSDSNGANGNALDTQGRLYSCERDGRRVVRREKDGRITVIASRFEGKRLNDPNDVVVRRDGQVYFSDSEPKDSLQHFELGYPGVYHVTPQGKISLVAKMSRPNGVTLTPDGHTLYIADTMERKIIAYDLDTNGNPSRQRIFISGIDGGPDGLRVAASGNVYIAARGIAVYSPAGKLIQTIELPETPANCSFGGRDLQTLYITARTSVYRVRIAEKGSLLY
jgi:gluconolactonase